MSGIDKPVYLVAVRDVWAAYPRGQISNAVPAFESPEAADRYRRRVARRDGMPVNLYRVAEFKFSGRLMDG